MAQSNSRASAGASSPSATAWEGPVTAVDYESNIITTTAPLPADGSLDGQIILFSNPRYSRNTAYRIARVEAAGGQTRIRLDGTLLLGKGVVDAIKDAHTLTSLIPHEYARTVNSKDGSGFFRGKRIRTAAGATAEIASVRYGQPMSLTLQSTEGFHRRRRLLLRRRAARRPVHHHPDRIPGANRPRPL